jgi:hypothetical protein
MGWAISSTKTKCGTASFGAEKTGIEHAKDKMVGRGVLLDIARHQGLDWLPEGFAITNDMLDQCA